MWNLDLVSGEERQLAVMPASNVSISSLLIQPRSAVALRIRHVSGDS